MPFVELKKFVGANGRSPLRFKSFNDCCNGIAETSDNHSLCLVFLDWVINCFCSSELLGLFSPNLYFSQAGS
ncbi:MAG: hypothetical protein F6K39_47535 [Okeania sp. SIO3B3]|nr:hypothetical protein [Okeania sp. SIO3B3]